jgi:hypothetical protein
MEQLGPIAAGLEVMLDNRYQSYQITGEIQPPLLIVVWLW